MDLIEEKLDEITSDLALDDGREVEGAKVVGSGATVESETRSYASAVKVCSLFCSLFDFLSTLLVISG